MTDHQFAFDLEFAYDDVTEGMNDITRTGKQVMEQFLKMADTIADAMTEAGKSSQKAIDPLEAIGKAVGQTFKGITSSLEMMERQVRQVDMSKLEKDADKYGEMIKKAQANLNQLYAEAEKVKGSEEQHLKVLEKIVEAQAKINQMEQAQGQIKAFAEQEKAQQRMAEQQKQAAAQAVANQKILDDQRREAARQANADAKELAALEREITRESEKRLKDMASENKAQEKANAQALKQEALAAADALKKLEQAEKDAASAADDLVESQKQVGESIISIASEIRGPAVALAATLTLVLGASLKQFAGLSDQMTTFKAVSGATTKEIDNMVKAAKEIDGIPTESAAKASVALARAGLSARDTAAGLGIMGKAAIASGEDLETTSSLILSTNRAYGLANSELEKTGDIMAKVANATNSSISEIGNAMSIMGSSAKSNNQTLLSTATVFGLLRDQGVSAEMAATGYKNALNAMATPAKQTKEAMDGLYKTTDAAKKVFTENGKMKDFSVILDDLKSKLEGFDDITQANILEKIFPDERSLNIVRSYFGITEDKIKSTTAEISKFAGELDRNAKVMEESFGFQLRAMQKDVEDFKSGLGEDAAPVLKEFIGLLRSVMQRYEEMTPPLKAVIANGVLIVTGITSLIGVASQLVITIGGAVFAWNQYTAAAGRAAAANVIVGNSSQIASKGLGAAASNAGLLASIGFSGTLLGLAAVAAGVLAIVDAYDKWKKADDERKGREADYQAATAPTGALEAIRNKPADKVTPTEANAAARDAKNQIIETKRRLAQLQEVDQITRESRTGQATRDDRIRRLAIIKELRDAGVFDASNGVEDIAQRINAYSAKLQRLESQGTTAADLNLEKNQKKPPGQATPKTDGTATLTGVVDDKASKIIQMVDVSYDKILRERLAKAKENKPVAVDTHVHADEEMAPGPKTSPFGPRRAGRTLNGQMMSSNHQGQDYGAPEGTPIKSDFAGKVIHSGPMGGYGNTVVVDAGNGNFFLYGHMSDAYKRIADGAKVQKGQVLGAVGKTGNSTGPHLHKELRVSKTGRWEDAVPIDPITGRQSKMMSGPSQEEIEANIKIQVIQEKINQLKKEQAKLSGAAAAAIGVEIKKQEGLLAEAKGNKIDAADKEAERRKREAEQAEKQRIADEKAVAADLMRIRQQNRDAEIALMQEGSAKIEQERQNELSKKQERLDAELIDFKGNKQQEKNLIESYEKQYLLINAEYDQKQTVFQEQHQRNLRDLQDQYEQGRIDALDEGIVKQTALMGFGLKKQIDVYDDQLLQLRKNAEQNKDQIAVIENLKTQAGIAASKRLKDAVIQDEIDKAQFRKDVLQQSLNDTQTAFTSALDKLIADKAKKGVNTNKLRASLSQDEFLNVADSLGQSSVTEVVKNLKDQLQAVNDLEAAETKRRNGFRVGDDSYKKSLKTLMETQRERMLIQDKLNVLSDKEFITWLQGYQELKAKAEKVNQEFVKLQTGIQAVTSVAQSLFSQFGQGGQMVSQGLGIASNAIQTLMGLDKRMKSERKPNENILSTFFGNLENVKDVVGLITTGVGMVGGLLSKMVTMAEDNKRAYQELVRNRVNYELSQELNLSRELIEIRKSRGQSTLQEELLQIQREKEQRVKELDNQMDWRGKVKGTGLFGDVTMSDVYQYQQGIEQQKRESQDDAAARTRALEQAERQNQENLTQAHYARLADTRVQIAKTTKSRLLEIDAQYTKDATDLYQKLLTDQQGIINSQLSEDDKQAQLASLLAAYKAGVAGLDVDKEQAKRDAAFEKTTARLRAEATHQNALNSLKEDGFIKEREALTNARDQEQAAMLAERDRYKQFSTEWIQASQARADALIVANNRIKQSDEANARQREKDLANLRAQTALTNAGLTASGVDDTVASGKNTLADLMMQEADERRLAIANFGQDQILLTAISAKYAALRAKNEKDTQQSAFAAIRQDYETEQQRILTNQLVPLQQILDAENARVKSLRDANVELEHSLKLIDERYEKERKAQNLADRDQFNLLKSGAITEAELKAGAEEIANENIKNGKITNRSSKETQLRGLGVLLARQAQDAESKRTNEGYNATDNNLNTIGFADEMSGILGRQAAVIEAQKLVAKNAKEKSDLEAQGAALYAKYQDLQMEKLAAKQAMEKKGKEDTLQSNNEQMDSGWQLVNDTQKQMDAIQSAYDLRMKGVSNAFLVAGSSADVLLEKLKAWAPELATSSMAALSYINNIKTALAMPTAGPDSLYGDGFTADKPSVITPWDGSTGYMPLAMKTIAIGNTSRPNPLKNLSNGQMAMPNGAQVVDNSVHIGAISREVDAERFLNKLAAMGYGNDGVKTYGINAVSRH